MIEIYRNSTEYVGLTLYSNGQYIEPTDADGNPMMPVVRVLSEDGLTVLRDYKTSTRQDVGRYNFLLDLNLTQNESILQVEWNFEIEGDPATKIDYVEVVTPYVTPDTIKSSYPNLADRSHDEIKEHERLARLVIDAYTGQFFGKRRMSVKVYPNSVGTLQFFMNVLSIESLAINGAAVNPTGYRFDYGSNCIYVPRTSDTWEIKYDTAARPRSKSRYYIATGTFGYQTVPSDVNIAAKMLVNDYFCQDNMYRQKGIKAVRAADWRFDVDDRAFTGTGNIDVDRILDKYRVTNLVII